ncbi:MAG TPA: c-type cytochrome [Solirubrobacterales bacterium]|nr:c-type cytochrome [Solirubrobacterales bacterium]
MENETLFYICGGVLAVSAIIVTFVGLKSEKFPGRSLPLVIVWFAIFVIGATTFAVRYSVEHQEHEAHKLEQVNEEIEAAEGDSGDPADTGEAAEEGSAEEEPSQKGEPVGEPEGSESSEAGGDPAAGETIFAANCAVCHGDDGHGGAGGPDLTTMPLAQTEEGAIEQVTNGGGGMPPFGEQLSEEEISDVAAFVVHEIVGK